MAVYIAPTAFAAACNKLAGDNKRAMRDFIHAVFSEIKQRSGKEAIPCATVLRHHPSDKKDNHITVIEKSFFRYVVNHILGLDDHAIFRKQAAIALQNICHYGPYDTLNYTGPYTVPHNQKRPAPKSKKSGPVFQQGRLDL